MSDTRSQKLFSTSIPANETERRAALYRYKILDTPPEAAFDRITRLAAQMFNVPTVLISLVDETRAWFKSCIGFDACEVQSDAALYNFATLTDDLLIIPDTRKSDRFAQNPLVQAEPGVRFYAGAPLRSHDGFNLGTLCLLDTQPREVLSPEQQRMLTDLAAMASDGLKLRLAARQIAQQGVPDCIAGFGEDVSDHKHAEAAPRESESRLESIANLVPDLLWESEPDGSTNWYNQRWMEYTGQTFEQAIGWGWIDAIHPDDREGAVRFYREAVEQGMLLLQEHRIRRHDGAYRWFVVKASPLKDESGKVIKMYGAATDIHEQRVALEALRESEAKYRSLFKAMDEAYVVVEVMAGENGEWNDFLFLEVNPAFVKQTGMEYPVGRKATELLGTPNPHWAKVYGRVAETGEPIRFEEGEATLGRVFDLYVFRLGGEGSRRVAVLFTDITDRKREEAALRQSEERLRDVLNSMAEGFALLKSDFTILDVNEETLRLDGRSRDELIGRTHWDAFPGSKDLPVGELLMRVVRERTIASLEHEYHWPDGRSLWLDMRAYPTQDAGVAIFWRDVTDRKQAEVALRESEAKYRSLFTTMDQGFCIIEKVETTPDQASDFRYLTLNSAFERQTGMHDVIGKTIRDFVPNAEQSIIDIYDEVVQTGQPQQFEEYVSELALWMAAEVFPAQLPGQIAVLFSNVSERKRSQLALRESEERLQKAISIETVGVLFFTLDGRITDANETFLTISGYSRDELRNIADWHDSTPPEFWDATRGAALELATLGNTAPYEKQYIRPDGSRWWGLFSPTRLKGSGRNAECVEFVIDISDRKRAEDDRKRADLQLRRAAEIDAFRVKLSDALRSLCDPVEIQRTAMRVLGEYLDVDRTLYAEIEPNDEHFVIADNYVRGNFSKMIGRFPLSSYGEAANSQRLGETLVWSDINAACESEADIAALLAVGVRSIIGIPLLKGGRWVASLTVHYSSPRQWTPQEVAFVSETADRTWAAVERARTEAALRESEEKYRSLFESIHDGFALLEVLYDDDNRPVDCRFLEVSPSFETQTGLPQAQGKTLRELIPSIESDWFEYYHQALVTNALVHFEGWQDYLKSWFGVNAVPYGNPHDRQVVIVLQNINDRKQAEAERLQLIQEQTAREQERQRAETLAELDRAKTLFFSNVSHEFRTPLTLSLAPLQDALSDRTHPLDPVQRERLELVHRNNIRLLKLVNTLLDFSRMEAGRMEAVYEPTDLATYTAELSSVFRSAIENANLQLVVDCPRLPDPIYVDRQMWEKIVLNLLSNAFKFTFEGIISVSLKPKANTVELMVSDTGIGVFASELPHLFERFYQVKGAKGRSIEGSGIGLSLVQELVNRHGGAIAVTSAVDQGTTFTVTIPTGIAHLPADQISVASTLASTAVTANAFVEEALGWLPEESSEFQLQSLEVHAQSLKVQTLGSKRARILLVDDNADMRGYLRRLLSQYYEVEAVNDGLGALTAIRGGSAIYDLVLADVMMPKMDGLELLRSLRASPNTQTIPIILLSARAGEESQVEGLETGADDYLIKPFSARELLARVNANLQLAQLRREAVYREQVMQAVQTLNDRLEQQVKARTAQLEAINQELEAFSSAISHDLRTPLRYISSFAEQLQSKLNPKFVDESSLQTVNIITKSALEAEKMVDDLLEFSHLGQTQMYLTTVNVSQLVQQVREQLQPELIGRFLHWQIEPLATVEADPVLLRLVLQNLLSNAVKYTRNNTEAAIKIGSTEQKQEVVFFVRDNGAGFDMKYCDRLFSIFQRLHPREEFPGTGVGLATVRRIVHRHGGRIWAEGAIDQGATFYFSLPKHEAE